MRVALVFPLLILAACYAHANDSRSFPLMKKEDVSLPSNGAYLNTKYIESLSLTRSPRATNPASREYRYWQKLLVKKSTAGIEFTISTFHESLGYLSIDHAGVVRSKGGVAAGISRITVPTQGRIAVTIEGDTYEFQYVQKPESLVSRKTVVGVYLG